LYRRALEARERVLGPEHPDTVASVNNLAVLLNSQGDYAAAEPLSRRALEARERVLGPEHPDILNSVNNLAYLLYRKGDYTAAEPLYRRALEARERVLGPDHPDRVAAVNNLAPLLYCYGDYAAADPLYRRALEARERVLGLEYTDTVASVNNLAVLLYSQGDYAAAEPLYRRALEARECVLGPEHPDTLTSVNNLAHLLYSQGDYAAAEPLYRRALEALERVLGPEHPDTVASGNSLALLLYSQGDYAAAEPLSRRALEARERVLGPEHPDTLKTLRNLTDLLAKVGRPDESATLRKEYVARMTAEKVSAAPLTLRQLALECFKEGDYSRDEQLLRRVLKHDFELPGAHCHLARVLLLMDRDKEALAEVKLAWEHRAGGPPYIPQRIHFLQALFGLLDGIAPTESLQDLKRELLRPDAMMEWDLRRLLDHLMPRLTPEASELLEALSAAINDRAAMKHLETLPAWIAFLLYRLDIDYAARRFYRILATGFGGRQSYSAVSERRWDFLFSGHRRYRRLRTVGQGRHRSHPRVARSTSRSCLGKAWRQSTWARNLHSRRAKRSHSSR
jgi:tetratricopeptide (TPR) repeat protein